MNFMNFAQVLETGYRLLRWEDSKVFKENDFYYIDDLGYAYLQDDGFLDLYWKESGLKIVSIYELKYD